MPLGIDFVQILLHLFNIVILFGGLYIILYKPVKKFMSERTQYYVKMDQDKEKALADAEKLKNEYEEIMNKADDEIAEEKRKATEEMYAMRDEELEYARKEASRIISIAEEEATKKRQEIVDGARDDISDILATAADKLMLEGDTNTFYDAFLEDAERSS